MPTFVYAILIFSILAFSLGWIIRGASIRGVIGNLNIVRFSDGTVDLLLQITKEPSDLQNGQFITLKVNAVDSARN